MCNIHSFYLFGNNKLARIGKKIRFEDDCCPIYLHDYWIDIWDMDLFKHVRTVPTHINYEIVSCFSRGNDELVVGFQNGKIEMFNINKDKPQLKAEGDNMIMSLLSLYNGNVASFQREEIRM